MKYGQIITCDICGADLTKTGDYQMAEDKRKVDGDLILIKSICCPDCGARFPYSVTDKATRKMIRKREAYIGSIVHTMQSERIPATDPKIAAMLKKNRELGLAIREKMNALKAKYLQQGGETNVEK